MTAVVLARDEAVRLPLALASLVPGMPALVVDAESRDETVAVARALGARVVVRPWEGFVATRRFALSLVTTPWTLMLDADERLDARQRDAILATDPHGIDGFRLARATSLCGRVVRGCGWSGERLLRLFRTERARLVAAPAAGGGAELHERWLVDGRTADLPGELAHDSYPTLASYAEKFRRYTDLEAAALRRGPRGPRVVAFVRSLLRGAATLPWLYLGRRGWRDGWRGAFVSAASAAYPVAVCWKALAEGERAA